MDAAGTGAETAAARGSADCVLVAEGVTVRFRPRGRPAVTAVDNVSLTLGAGEAVGLIGESGSGKTTLGRVLAGLQRADEGTVRIAGRDAAVTAPRRPEGGATRGVQMVFQDAVGALNPRQTVRSALAEVLTVHRLVPRGDAAAREARMRELLDLVGLPAACAAQLPQELSGGQCQRVCLARALAVRPKIVIADEPVSALDVSVQARILRLLSGLRERLGLSLLFVAHDLAVVRSVCDRVYVLHGGRVVESGATEDVLHAPRSAYTRGLLAAVPDVERALGR